MQHDNLSIVDLPTHPNITTIDSSKNNYESFDFHVSQIDMHRKLNLKRIKIYHPRLLRWILTLFIAILIGISRAFIVSISDSIFELRLNWMTDLMKQDLNFAALFVFLTFGLLAAIIVGWLVSYLCPIAGGSGVPETTGYLNGALIPSFLSLPVYLVRVFGLILVTSCGFYVGGEGPMAHIGAIVASAISQGYWRIFQTNFAFVKHEKVMLRNHRDKFDFISMGAGMGVASAFGAPIGGMLFTMEEASSYWNSLLTWRTFFGCAVCSYIARILIDYFHCVTGIDAPGHDDVVCVSSAGFFSFPIPNQGFLIWEVITFVIIGVIFGLLGALFSYIVRRIFLFRWRIFRLDNPDKTRRFLRVVEICVVICITIALSFGLSYAFSCQSVSPKRTLAATILINGNLKSIELPHEISFFSSNCDDPANEYNDIASILLQHPYKAIRALYSCYIDDVYTFRYSTLAVAFVVIYSLTTITYGSAIPSGLFLPNILSGACLGRFVGKFVFDYIDDSTNPGIYALLGSAGMLGGFSRMTVSLTVLIVELTSNTYLIVPIVLVVISSKLVADLFNPGAYEVVAKLKEIPILRFEYDAKMKDYTMKNIASLNVICIESRLRYSVEINRVRHILQTCKHNGFPVVKNARLVGLISRIQLESILKDADVSLLHYPMNKTPISLSINYPLIRGYRLFNLLGLRHIPLVDDQSRVVGIVTRKDFVNFIYKGPRRDASIVNSKESIMLIQSMPNLAATSSAPKGEEMETNLATYSAKGGEIQTTDVEVDCDDDFSHPVHFSALLSSCI